MSYAVLVSHCYKFLKRFFIFCWKILYHFCFTLMQSLISFSFPGDSFSVLHRLVEQYLFSNLGTMRQSLFQSGALHFLQSQLGTEPCCHWEPQSWHSPSGLLVRQNAISRRKPLNLHRFLRGESKGCYREEEDEHFRQQMAVRPTRQRKSKGAGSCLHLQPWHSGGLTKKPLCGLHLWFSASVGPGSAHRPRPGISWKHKQPSWRPLSCAVSLMAPRSPPTTSNSPPHPHRRALPSKRGSAPSGFRNLKLTVPAQSPWSTFAERNLLHGEISDQALAGLLPTTEGYES